MHDRVTLLTSKRCVFLFIIILILLKIQNCQCELKLCPETPPNRLGKIPIDFKRETLEAVETRLGLSLQPGGWFSPTECKARDRVAILIPMRGREHHLPIILKNLHPMLMKQQIEYGIYVIEQTLDQNFNRGLVFNIGFVEALKMKDWDCFIFHDIDMIPFDDRNIYNCPPNDSVRHMGVSLDKFKYQALGNEHYGGVIAFKTEQFKQINGFSNLFWNWGGEDDDLGKRIKRHGFNVMRPSIDIARYKTLPHEQSKRNKNRYKLLRNSDMYFDINGLNSLLYHIKDFKIKSTHVHIVIDYSPVEYAARNESSESYFSLTMLILIIFVNVYISLN